MLVSASKVKGIERVVITGSILSIASFSIANTGAVVDGVCTTGQTFLEKALC